MTFEVMSAGALDYLPCRYGNSKLLFRGPRRKLDKDYVAFIGGTETYGKFLQHPFPDLVEYELGLPCVNFGCVNAGTDVFVNDPFVPTAAAKAKVTVLQVLGAQNLSNRYYTVHPRRNDRFVKASKLLSTIYRDVDFTEFHFTKHLLSTLQALSAERFEAVQEELQEAWVARTKLLLSKVSGKSILLWFADHAPDGAGQLDTSNDPLFVTREMIERVRGEATSVVEVTASKAAMEEGSEGMVFSQMEAPAAGTMLGPMAHKEAAAALTSELEAIL